MKTLRIGMVGCGQICRRRHAPEYLKNPNCQIAAFYDADIARARAMADEFGGRACKSLDELLSCDVDAVSVCSANASHPAAAVAAMEAGRDVLCEKPLAVTLEDCEAMYTAARRTGRRLLAGHNQRLAPAHTAARDMIARGDIGRVLTFHTTFGHGGPESWTGQRDPWFFHRDQAVLGVAADLGIHKIDLYNFLTGDIIVKASAFLSTLDKTLPDGSPIQVDDNALFILRTRGGAMGMAHASWTYYGREDNSTVLYGTRGIMKLYADPHYSVIVERPDGSEEKYPIDPIVTNNEQQAGVFQSSGVIDEFVSAVQEHRPSCLDVDHIIHAMRVVFAAIQSQDEERAVRVTGEN